MIAKGIQGAVVAVKVWELALEAVPVTRKETNFNRLARHVLVTRNHPTRRPNLLLCKLIRLCKWSIVYLVPDQFSDLLPERFFALSRCIGDKLLFFGLHSRS